ncbi:type II toxin-antitoxin system VapC family toxin [Sphingosinicella sp. LHD-64]|uniref:type II toxin-antitoxin system VapC family toxin n=1 Tax=Sphingosinicella sp. LHD-64 TaxID=3072139 RepID=UPI0028101457|nr:type II toxin-antitoxin system VapC family toxin [Sphingosinicella sp. LHD-64]MDQ8756068.1 type II toxin-antitoxin system VapC family toxin [Sphingosinicella sp. LHD-64]
MILLDTATLVWFTLGDGRLGPESRRLIETGNAFSLSAITPWEVAMLVGKGRLNLGQGPLDWISRILSDPRMELVPVAPKLAVAAGLLPPAIHGDPADRLILATANDLVCPVLTPDEKILEYAAQGHVQALDARH